MAEIRGMTDELNEAPPGGSRPCDGRHLDFRFDPPVAQCDHPAEGAPAGVLVSVREGATTHLFAALAAGELDIVVGRLPERATLANMHALSHHALFEEALCVVVGKGYRMGADRVTHLAQLDRRVVDPARRTRRRAWRPSTLFRAAGLPLPTDIVESLSILTNIGLLLRAPYVALMPHGRPAVLGRGPASHPGPARNGRVRHGWLYAAPASRAQRRVPDFHRLPARCRAAWERRGDRARY